MIAVTGAGGFFGCALEAQLASRGQLRGLFRTPSDASRRWQEKGHDVVVGDIADRAALAALVDGADVVYHLAARMAKNDRAESHRVNVEGTEALARAALAAGVRRLVYVSSISIYAATRPADHIVTEDTEPLRVDRLNAYSSSKYAGERIVRELTQRGEGPAFTIVRPTNVYGPWGKSWFLDWIARLERVPAVIGGNVAVDLVHVDDVATALIQAGEEAGAAGETIHIGHDAVTLTEYGGHIGRIIDRKIWKLPRGLDFAARVLVEHGHRLLKGDHMSTPLTRRVSFPHTKAEKVIGYRPRVRLEAGLESMKRWYEEVYAREKR